MTEKLPVDIALDYSQEILSGNAGEETIDSFDMAIAEYLVSISDQIAWPGINRGSLDSKLVPEPIRQAYTLLHQ